jgi:PBSX family phage terminase large subunit
MIEFNPKQAELIKRLKNNTLARINILEGAVRSGKTWISLIVFALWVATMPKDATFLMVARTLTTLKRNCLELLQSLVGEDNFSYNISQKQGTLFGRTVYLEGVNDVRSEGKIRGMTLTGAYCDELTLFTAEFFEMLLSRLSMPGAKLFATTNPDSPLHWFCVKFLKRAKELDILVVKFTIDDNQTLDPAYVEALKKEYTGVFYKRFILGLWVVADGACYPKFADRPDDYIIDELPEGANFISIGVDFGGNRSLTTFVATAFHGNYDRLTVVKDHHIAGRKGEIDADRVNKEFIQFVTELRAHYNIPVKYVFADSEAQYLINGMRKAAQQLGLSIGDSQKVEVVQRIICTNSLLNTGRFKIMRNCQLVRDGLMGAVWNPKAAEKGRDERLDDFTSDIDILDATEYSFERFISRLTPKR